MRRIERQWLTAEASRRVAVLMASGQHGSVARRQLIAAGVPRWFVRRELAAGRWQQVGRQVVVIHNGPLADGTRRSAAVLESGPSAALAGVSALQEAGLSITEPVVHVIVPPGSRPRQRGVGGRRRPKRPERVRVHESRRAREEDLVDGPGPRRAKPGVAAVQAALWARSDRQAELYVLMAVQHRLVTVEALAEAVGAVRRDPRRRLLTRLVRDAAGGVQSLGELDVARDFRRRGFPEPDRQVLRTRPTGRQYLDVALAAYRLAFEIDGSGHDVTAQRLEDLVRDIDLHADGDTVVRIPLAAYWLDRERVLDALERLLRSRGWRPAAA